MIVVPSHIILKRAIHVGHDMKYKAEWYTEKSHDIQTCRKSLPLDHPYYSLGAILHLRYCMVTLAFCDAQMYGMLMTLH